MNKPRQSCSYNDFWFLLLLFVDNYDQYDYEDYDEDYDAEKDYGSYYDYDYDKTKDYSEQYDTEPIETSTQHEMIEDNIDNNTDQDTNGVSVFWHMVGAWEKCWSIYFFRMSL